MAESNASQANITVPAAPRLQLENISKTFPGVRALDKVSLTVLPGEIHALLGENGAGKSTLMHIISGVYIADQGAMALDGSPYQPADERAAQEAGVAIVFQEGSLFPPLNIAENIFAGRQPLDRFGLIDSQAIHRESKRLLDRLKVNLSTRTPVMNLSPGQRQLVEIAKALSQNLRLLILDEPTSSLTPGEAQHLFAILKQLAAEGIGIIYVSHRLGEIFEIADRVTILRDGCVTGVREVSKTTPDELIQLEVGRALSFAREVALPDRHGKVVLEVENVAAPSVMQASLKVHAGEIVCLAGLVGAGRTELLEVIFGARTLVSGMVKVNGYELKPKHPLDAMRSGIGMVPEDRRDAGLFLDMAVKHNIAAANMVEMSPNGIVNDRAIEEIALKSVEQLRIATRDVNQQVIYLSGGNQQKVLLARWLARKPSLLLVDEPTRGVDVGAKADVYTILRELAQQGVALLVVSSDLVEVLTLAHRIVVMAEGYTVGELDPDTTNEAAILQMATPQSVIAANETV